MVADLTVRLEQAMGRIAELEARLKQSSANSSKPPSSDGLVKPAPKSLRGRSGRGPGRPSGQPGVTLRQVADPDVVVRHVPSVCGGCGDDLADAVEVGVARRQVFDIPEPAVVVTEHQIVTVACGCGHHTTAAGPGLGGGGGPGRRFSAARGPAVVVTEHQIVTVACGCGHHTTAEAPAGATAPVSYGPRIAAIGVYLLHGQFLSVGRTAHALRD